MSTKIQGGSSTAGLTNVDGNYNLQVITPGNNASGAAVGGGSANAPAMYSEIDAGTITGTRYTLSPETDDDYRLRVAMDVELDDETFDYTAQNTGKHNNQSTTMTFTYGTGGLVTNGSSITTTTTGVSLQTYANFPLLSSGTNLYCQFEGSFSAQPVANTIVDCGMFLRPTSNPYAPTDGAYFRLTSAGLFGVINHNGTETTTSVFSFTYTNSSVYKFTIVISNDITEFWIDDILYGSINTPVSQAQPFMSTALPFSMRHVISGGAAGAVFQFTLRGYGVSLGGLNVPRQLGELGNAVFGSYQGLSGGTMGSLATYANSTNPTAAAPSNTALTANLPAGLGGQGAVTAAAAAATDGIWGSYQVPAGTVSIPGKRLKITGVIIDAVNNGAAVATTATTLQFSLAYGHTAVSMATAEAATTKAPRRIALGFMTWAVGAAIGAQPQFGPIRVDFKDAPVYVNPSEFVALVGKFLVGTATASQVINFTWQPIYSWE